MRYMLKFMCIDPDNTVILSLKTSKCFKNSVASAQVPKALYLKATELKNWTMVKLKKAASNIICSNTFYNTIYTNIWIVPMQENSQNRRRHAFI